MLVKAFAKYMKIHFKNTENGVTKQNTGGTLMLLHSTPLKGMRSEMSSNLELKGKINVCSKGSRPQAIESPNRPDHKILNKQINNNKNMKRTEKGSMRTFQQLLPMPEIDS